MVEFEDVPELSGGRRSRCRWIRAEAASDRPAAVAELALAIVLLTATEVLVKDYRGKNAEQEIWEFDAALVSQINDVLMLPALW